MISHRISAAILLGATSALILGCGEGLPDRFPVEGSVTRDGKPLVEATVLFHPQGHQTPGLAKPMALTDEQGRFRLTTHESDDGAVAGDYVITVTQPALVMVGEEETRNGPNTLPPAFAKPETSPVKFTVVDGPNVVPPIAVD